MYCTPGSSAVLPHQLSSVSVAGASAALLRCVGGGGLGSAQPSGVQVSLSSTSTIVTTATVLMSHVDTNTVDSAD